MSPNFNQQRKRLSKTFCVPQTSLPRRSSSVASASLASPVARSLLRIDGPSVAERSRAGFKEQRSAEYLRYSSERRHLRGGAGELCSTAPGAGGVEPCQGSTFSRRPDSARHATPGGYAQQAPKRWQGLLLLRQRYAIRGKPPPAASNNASGSRDCRIYRPAFGPGPDQAEGASARQLPRRKARAPAPPV